MTVENENSKDGRKAKQSATRGCLLIFTVPAVTANRYRYKQQDQNKQQTGNFSFTEGQVRLSEQVHTALLRQSSILAQSVTG